MDGKANRAVKDSVFTNLFARKKYTLELYRALFPDDTDDLTEDDFEIITLENVLMRDIYNDLGILVKNKLILLVEAQSTWSRSITFRMFMYLAGVYKEYIVEHELDLYTDRVPKLPEPELYVIYTGENKNLPDTLSLADVFFGGKKTVDLNVKVITNGVNGDIIYQYVAFTRVVNEQIKQHGYTKTAIAETIRICKDENVLREYLISCEKEVFDMLDVLFDHDFIAKAHDNTVREEGIKEGIKEGALSAFAGLVKKGMLTIAQAAAEAGMTVPEFQAKTGLNM
ncbi:MAG: hypothetical protein IJH94_00505 [Clostridia bacterium]|nr:hypothetical protein [Clostridia bacterium]